MKKPAYTLPKSLQQTCVKYALGKIPSSVLAVGLIFTSQRLLRLPARCTPATAHKYLLSLAKALKEDMPQLGGEWWVNGWSVVNIPSPGARVSRGQTQQYIDLKLARYETYGEWRLRVRDWVQEQVLQKKRDQKIAERRSAEKQKQAAWDFKCRKDDLQAQVREVERRIQRNLTEKSFLQKQVEKLRDSLTTLESADK